MDLELRDIITLLAMAFHGIAIALILWAWAPVWGPDLPDPQQKALTVPLVVILGGMAALWLIVMLKAAWANV